MSVLNRLVTNLRLRIAGLSLTKLIPETLTWRAILSRGDAGQTVRIPDAAPDKAKDAALPSHRPAPVPPASRARGNNIAAVSERASARTFCYCTLLMVVLDANRLAIPDNLYCHSR
jgi:hypothetical protein